MRFTPALFLSLAVCCAAQPAAVPDNLNPPADATLLLQLYAIGDQVYLCDGTAWMLSHPDAKLFNSIAEQVGTHFAGPTWEYFDSSRVTGKAIANATPDPDSIPWLLVQAKDHLGDGLMQKVAFIQRLNTKGGKAPSTGCDAAHKGQETRSPYSADYLFYAIP